MALWLDVQYLGDAEASLNSEVQVTTESFLVGRSPACQLRLADRDKLISSTHAAISRMEESYCITDTSTNGTLLNGTRLLKNTLQVLREGDELRIGDYRLLVSRIEQDRGGIETTEDAIDQFGRMPAQSDNRGASAEDAVALDPELHFDEDKKPADIMGLLDDAHSSAAGKDDFGWDEPLPPHGSAEEKGGPLEDLMEPPQFTSDPDLPNVDHDDPFADWLPEPGKASTSNESIDWPADLPDDTPVSRKDAVAEDPFAPHLPAPEGAVHSDLRDSGAREGAGTSSANAQRQATPEPRSLPSQSSQVLGDRLLDALLDGLEMPPHTRLDPETARAMGRSLRVLLQGTRELIHARDAFKNSMRLARTMIQAKDNNPYKVAVDTDDLIDQLFLNPRRGYLSAIEASKATIADLGQHETAVVQGLRAMGGELAKTIHPEKLAREFAHKQKFSKIETLQKAQYWDAFVAYFDRELVEGDPLTELFAKVYDEVILEMQRSQR